VKKWTSKGHHVAAIATNHGLQRGDIRLTIAMARREASTCVMDVPLVAPRPCASIPLGATRHRCISI
jgi:hypothetical protein